jgi:hypothetical protein
MTPIPHPRRLAFPREPPRIHAYANLYRFGKTAGPAPLLVYIGGATNRQNYLMQYETEPTPIVSELARALELQPLPTLDALICPCPLDSGGEGHEYFVDHFDSELCPELGAPPAALVCVGYSAGAGYATHLAIVAEARALAVFGSAGVHQAAADNRTLLEQSKGEGTRPFEIAIFRNDSDSVVAPPQTVAAQLRPLHAHAMAMRSGQHKFADYAANGTVRDAFRFAIERLSEG